MVAGPSPHNPGSRVKFPVEVRDPCPHVSYQVNDIAVSDFYTPHFFDPVEAPGVRYSFTGALTSRRQVLQGGSLTWYDPALRQWWHRAWFAGADYTDAEVPIPPVVRGNIRATIDRHFGPKVATAKQNARASNGTRHQHAGGPRKAFTNRADDLRRTFAPQAWWRAHRPTQRYDPERCQFMI